MAYRYAGFIKKCSACFCSALSCRARRSCARGVVPQGGAGYFGRQREHGRPRSCSLFVAVRGRQPPAQTTIFVWRWIPISAKKELELNEEIRDRELRVIADDGTQLGVMSGRDAYRLAMEKGMDLVKIAPQANPPVCKIMDYGKYRFEQQKKEKEARKNQRVVEIKEVRLSLNIDTHDFNTKAAQAAKFLKGGDKVKVSIRFRGREMAHTSLGLDVLKRFAEAVEGAVVEKQPKLEGRSMSMFMAPQQKTVAQKNAKQNEGGTQNA